MSGATVYLNGRYLPRDQAQVSVLDRGFLLADGVYEVIPCYNGQLFRLSEHLKRLQHSLDAVRIPNPHRIIAWEQILNSVVQRNGGGHQSVYLQVTRGSSDKRDHGFPAQTQPTVLVMSQALSAPHPGWLANGIAAVTLEDIRWQWCHIKAIALLPNVLLRQQAMDEGAAEAILVRGDQVTEGAASNVFMLADGMLLTPPKSEQLLPGITRDLVLELAAANGIECREESFTREQLRQADEIWVTSSTREVLPVTSLDGQAVGEGKPGAVWQTVYDAYQKFKAHYQ